MAGPSSGEVVAVWCCSVCGAVYYKDYPHCPNDGGEVVVALRDPMLDATIGRYVIDKLIGEGGMGRVYLAHHAHLPNKRYAVKVLLGDAAATASMRKRFAREAEATSKLVHPNIVGVIDYGETTGGLPYIVMDYVDGRPLVDMLHGGMAVPRVLRLVRAICEGLACAHAAGIVHRDLKPANVLVEIQGEDEVPRIADFGLALATESNNERLTTAGMTMGTPAYAPPEQLAGRTVDHRTDLYAIGMTMFEMLTGGTLPFEGPVMETAGAKMRREAPTLAEVEPSIRVPDALQALISKLLRRHPADRPESATEVIAAIDDIVLQLAVDERAATVADPTGARWTAPLPTKRRRRWVVPVGAVAAVLAAGVATIWIASGSSAAPGPVAALDTHPRDAVPKPAPQPPVAQEPATQLPAPQPPEPPPPEPQPPEIQLPDPRPPAPRHATPQPSRPRPHHAASHTPARVEPAPVLHAGTTTVAPAPAPAPAPVPTPPVPTPPVPTPPAPVTPVALDARIAAVTVHGSLPEGVVRRAVDRVVPALRQCVPAAPQTVQVRFTIDESRRAQHIGGASACIVGALGGVRTEVAPDVGDVEVTVQIVYEGKS